MKLSRDESRALAFVLGLVGLSVGVRYVRQPPPVEFPASMSIDAASLEKASKAAMEKEKERARPLAKDERLDVNRASADQLERLPGVGPSLAHRMVDERERNGAFDSAADLRAVSGVGPKMLEKITPHLTFGGGSGLRPRRHDAETRGRGDAENTADESPRPRVSASPGPSVSPRPRVSASPRSPASAIPPATPIRLNRATAADLEKLPGIGPALAARIVAYRDSAGPFRTLAELDRVPGIGPALLKKLAERVDINR